MVTKRDYTIYFLVTGAFGIFAWILFLCYFDTKEKVAQDPKPFQAIPEEVSELKSTVIEVSKKHLESKDENDETKRTAKGKA